MPSRPATETPPPDRVVPNLGYQPGRAFLWRADDSGWCHPPLHLPDPLLLLRVTHEGTIVQTPEGELVARSEDILVTPFVWIEEILSVLADASRETERRLFLRPVLPLAVVAMSYEFGRIFNPHEHCFPFHKDAPTDDLLVSFHTTGFARIDGAWKMVGRPLVRPVTWGNWKSPRRALEWPSPLSHLLDDVPPRPTVSYRAPEPCLSREQHAMAVGRIREHLSAGDIYQANMTVRFDGATAASPEKIFAAGLEAGGERFSALVRGVGGAHISFSPELLLRRWGRSISTRPIKGTRARLGDPELDSDIARELLQSPKDRAEHVMIVDLERNDLGRLSEYGSVRVDPLMQLTRHPTVFHMESTVSGLLRGSLGLRELFTAIFPGGSVTGAPKKRALEVIASLENRPRGLYCGALGWIDTRGDCEFNLPIRTGWLSDDGTIQMHAGGAIVADSTSEDEWEELLAKTRFLGRAIEIASQDT